MATFLELLPVHQELILKAHSDSADLHQAALKAFMLADLEKMIEKLEAERDLISVEIERAQILLKQVNDKSPAT